MDLDARASGSQVRELSTLDSPRQGTPVCDRRVKPIVRRTDSVPPLSLAIFAALFALCPLLADEPALRSEDLPHLPAIEPAQAIASFVVRPGFHLEFAAHEPEVMDPIAISFDEKGRVYVVEMRDYSERRPERLGRIRRLEDRDGDGYYETSAVYIDNLAWPTAVTCWNGGVFVGSTPDLIYAKDTDGDGKADLREVVITGFASDFAPYATNKLNVQAMMNSLRWGLDCRIHGCGSMNGGKIHVVDSPFTRGLRGPTKDPAVPTAGIIDLHGRDFSFDPRLMDLRPETGGGQYGMYFDDVGRKFFCSNSDHLQVGLYEERYSARNTGYPLPTPRASIATDGPAAEVFRISPEEPWRVIRTRWRVTGLVEGLIEGGGRASGYFTSATGLTLYRGDAYGPEFAGDAFVADCGSNLIHRKKLHVHGTEITGTRPADEEKREFIASRDTWFRPVDFANAPDGCLWAIDMYREIIEHPWSLPPNIKRLLDLNAGNDRGRLYRIAPDGRTLRRKVDLSVAATGVLVETLSHSNSWHRETAARLLVERHHATAVPALRETLRGATASLGRLHALYVLEALGACGDAEIERALRDVDEAVRIHGIRLLEFHHASTPLPDTLSTLLEERAGDSPGAQLQMALTLGSVAHPKKVQLLSDLLRRVHRAEGQGLIADAALSSAGTNASAVFGNITISDGTDISKDWLANEHLPQLAEIIGRRNREEETRQVVWVLLEPPLGGSPRMSPSALRITARLAEGMRRSGGSLAKADPENRLAPVHALARVAATKTTRIDRSAGQVEAIRLLGHLPAAQVREALRPVLVGGQPDDAQRAAVEEILRTEEADATEEIFRAWPGVVADSRGTALEIVLRRGSGPGRVLDAIAAKKIAPRDLSMAQLTALRGHKDAAMRARAAELLGAPVASRDDAVARMLPALNLKGDIQRGLAMHEAQCQQCHRLGGKGQPLGPDLESVKSQPKEKLLVAIVDPNREVQPAFLATTVETTDEEAITGLAEPETPSGIVVRQAGGIRQSIAHNRIRKIRAEGKSIMPEGFETALTQQQLADLLAALTGAP